MVSIGSEGISRGQNFKIFDLSLQSLVSSSSIGLDITEQVHSAQNENEIERATNQRLGNIISLISGNNAMKQTDYVHNTQPKTQIVPNLDVSFTNGELHQAYGHVMLTMST